MKEKIKRLKEAIPGFAKAVCELILFNPLGLGTVQYVFAGLAFILEAVIDFMTVIPLNKNGARNG